MGQGPLVVHVRRVRLARILDRPRPEPAADGRLPAGLHDRLPGADHERADRRIRRPRGHRPRRRCGTPRLARREEPDHRRRDERRRRARRARCGEGGGSRVGRLGQRAGRGAAGPGSDPDRRALPGGCGVLPGAVRGHHRSRHARPGRRQDRPEAPPRRAGLGGQHDDRDDLPALPRPRSARGRSQARVFGVRTPASISSRTQAITSSSIVSSGVVASKSRIAFALRTSGTRFGTSYGYGVSDT